VDFRCSNPDGSLVDRSGFLAQTARPVTISDLHNVRWTTGRRPLHRCLGAPARRMARRLGPCDALLIEVGL